MSVFRHSTSFVRSRWKASVNSMLISRFSSHSSLRKLNRTCFLGVYHIYKTWPVKTKSTIQDQFNGVYNLPLHNLLFNFSGSQPILLIHGSLIIIWKAISSHQIKKWQLNKKTNKNDVNVQKWHFAQANEIAALGFAALSDHILALGYHLCRYKSIFADVLWQSFERAIFNICLFTSGIEFKR